MSERHSAESVCPAGPDGVHYFFSDDECAYCHKLDQHAEYVAIGRDKRASGVSEDDLIAAASQPVPSADLGRKAKAAWNSTDGDYPPHDVWWDSTQDAWIDGYETGYKAALAELNDGDPRG